MNKAILDIINKNIRAIEKTGKMNRPDLKDLIMQLGGDTEVLSNGLVAPFYVSLLILREMNKGSVNDE